MIVATFDDFAPEGPHETAPSLLNYFLGEVKDGIVYDSSLDTAKKWMDATGCSPYYQPREQRHVVRARSYPHDECHVHMACQDDRQCIQQVPPLRQLRRQAQGLPPEVHAPLRRPLHPRAGPGQDVGADPGRARGRPEQRSAIAKKADVKRVLAQVPLL